MGGNQMKVKEILRIKGNALFTVTPESKLSDCVVLMAEHDIGSLVVMSSGQLVGMLTFREVIRILAKRQIEQRLGPTPAFNEITLAQVMNVQPTVASSDMEVDELRKLMLENHQRYMPVLDDDVVQGVVSFHDVAKAVLEEQEFENKMLKGYIRDWPLEANS
jgi:CBS domain-containing protein